MSSYGPHCTLPADSICASKNCSGCKWTKDFRSHGTATNVDAQTQRAETAEIAHARATAEIAALKAKHASLQRYAGCSREGLFGAIHDHEKAQEVLRGDVSALKKHVDELRSERQREHDLRVKLAGEIETAKESLRKIAAMKPGDTGVDMGRPGCDCRVCEEMIEMAKMAIGDQS